MEVLGLYDIIQLVGYDPVFCLLALRCSQEIDWSCYGGNYTTFFGYDSNTDQVFDVPPLLANKSPKMGSSAIFDTQGHGVQQLCEIQLSGIQSCETA